MAVQTVNGRRVGEGIEDLIAWLRGLQGCPPVTATAAASCDNPAHGPGATWFFVEADAAGGVARLRCIGCAQMTPLLDSEEHWTHPPMWSCPSCSNSIAEVGYGLSVHNGLVGWLAVGVRCVECRALDGVTDIRVPDLPTDEVLERL